MSGMLTGHASDRVERLEKLVNASGFVFQLAVEEAVRSSFDRHGWDVEAREYPWRSDASGGYIDIVLSKGPFRMVVECKRRCRDKYPS